MEKYWKIKKTIKGGIIIRPFKEKTTQALESALFRARGVIYAEYQADFQKKLQVAKDSEKEYRELKAKGFA
ncbi:hypothetical protein [Ammoniphilus sp. CFH 90114]|uniref:hypothetical protein n=1 Tax=Ammoniphilus sp. CFH 90114 TaxID=2493665 RepID=UPI00100F399E|nr:hypothetical protein [Ammoniphilus sp. CFH 90114]RXT14909.1 hypothetical protein EIZ39_01490 [Ammoniphilus sp. CFH 90114]